MKQVKQYNAIRAKDPAELIPLVEKFIEEGWQPWGGPYLHGGMVYQTMVRYEDNVEEDKN